ncbi:MAG: flagellar hook-length control protein FliK [Lachnospira sp.]|nr:flagellar hook-length control protein FliK [Lachnospira sp.]
MVSSAITGSSRIASADVTQFATNVKTGKVNSFSDVMAKSLADNSSVGNRTSSGSEVMAVKDTVKTEKAEPVKDNAVDKDTEIDRTDDYGTDRKEEVVSESEEAAKDILEKIQEELNVSEEELNECMEVLGLSLLDLLQPGNILKLVMEVTGAQDAMFMVTDADLSAALKNILDYAGIRIGELADQLDMTPGNLQSMLESLGDEADDDGKAEELVEVNADAGSETVEDVIASKITVNNTEKPGAENNSNNSANSQNQMMEQAEGKAEVPVNSMSDMVSQLSQNFEAALNLNVDSINQADVVRQVVDSIKLNNTQALQSIEIALNPENLGKVNVLVSVREGVITAQIMTENEQVKRAIESQLSTLKETFESQGVKVEAVEVTVQSHAFENHQGFEENRDNDHTTSKARKKINLDNLNFDEEVDEAEESAATLVNENSSVEYLA